ncbi:hypothetical protein BS17DRAFT_783419 [Gyrodon lividus]|nr:hypothetical protein BS17DRAFT_783419 [Gyrodon lividus]
MYTSVAPSSSCYSTNAGYRRICGTRNSSDSSSDTWLGGKYEGERNKINRIHSPLHVGGRSLFVAPRALRLYIKHRSIQFPSRPLHCLKRSSSGTYFELCAISRGFGRHGLPWSVPRLFLWRTTGEPREIPTVEEKAACGILVEERAREEKKKAKTCRHPRNHCPGTQNAVRPSHHHTSQWNHSKSASPAPP